MKFIYILVVVVVFGVLFFVWQTNQVNDYSVEQEHSSAQVDVESDGDTTVQEITFDVVGTNFDFDIKEIKVTEGDLVTINFSSDGGFHDWVVDEFDVATAKIQEGQSTSVTFVADKAGTFEYYCSIGQHRAQGMVGNLVVEAKS